MSLLLFLKPTKCCSLGYERLQALLRRHELSFLLFSSLDVGFPARGASLYLSQWSSSWDVRWEETCKPARGAGEANGLGGCCTARLSWDILDKE